MHSNTEQRRAELQKLELELKIKIDNLNSYKKDEQIQMLEKANELDSIRENMEKSLADFESFKSKKSKARESLKLAERILNQKPHLTEGDRIESNRSKQYDSTIDLDTGNDIENTNPNTQNKFYDSSTNVIFQSPTRGDDLSENDLKDERVALNEVVVNRNKDTPVMYSKYQRSISRGAHRSSQIINPLTESYECQNKNMERYNSVGNLGIKPKKIKKSKERNSYRFMHSSSSQAIMKNIKIPLGKLYVNSHTE
jgi:hypothetical protein